MTLSNLVPVANHLWQSTVFVGVVWLLSVLLRHNRAAVRYWLWLAASLKFLIPFSALVAIGRQVEWRSAVTSQADMTLLIDTIGQPFSSAVAAAAPSSEFAHSGLIALLPVVLLTLWCAGSVMHVVAWAVRWRRVAAIVRQAVPLEDGRELTILRRVAAMTGWRHPVTVVTSNASLEPGVFGVLRPVLFWPRGISVRLSDQQVQALLTHELCHVRRRDNLAAGMHMLIEAAFWFHPIVWWIEHHLVDERERACDEEVIRLGSDPLLYAESILKTCEFYAESPLVCVAGITGSDLKKRVEAIMRDVRGRRLEAWKRTLLAGVVAATIAAPVGIGLLTAMPLRAAVQAPTTAPRPEFEVASIKPNRSSERAGGMRMLPSGQATVTNMPLSVLIRTVYQLEGFQISGGPGWLDSERFNIDAKGASNLPPAQTMQMMRSLLEDRFKLVAHLEARDLPIYVLVTSRSDRTLGPRLRKAQLEECPPRPMGSLAGAVPDRREPPCGVLLFGGPGTEGLATGKTVPIAQLASRLAPLVRRKVIDRTGLVGRFDLDLQFTPSDVAPSGGSTEIADTSSVFTALQEQLGLRLESTRGPVDVLVIDSVERPTDDAADTISVPQDSHSLSTQSGTSSGSIPAFEVASIKPSKLADDRVISSTLPNRYTSINITPQMLILTAYQLQASQLAGGPAWITSARFDIEAKSERAFTVQELFPMLQNLLAVDFGLTFHHETRAIPAYSLVLANARVKNGRLKPGSIATCASGQQPRRGPQNPDAPLACGAVQVSPGHWTARSVPMTRLVNYLAGRVSRVVVDRTGLEGLFDVELDYTPDRIPPGALGNGGDLDLNAPSLFTALQEQLGLRLESSKNPVAVMVIDRIERPTEH